MKVCTIIICLCTIVESVNILGIFHLPSYSHHTVFQAIYKALSKHHKVTVVTPFSLNDPALVNLTEINISDGASRVFKGIESLFLVERDIPSHVKLRKAFELSYKLSEVVLNERRFIDIYNASTSEIDLVIVQEFFSPVLYPVAAKLGAPLVGVSSMGVGTLRHLAMGNPNPLATYSDILFPHGRRMKLFQKIKNVLYYMWSRYYLNFEALPKCDQIARKYLGNDLPYIQDIEKNMSLLLLTTNPILYEPRPNVPTVISMEQMHIKPVKPLPKDLKQFLDSAKEGAVYFSLGSNVKSINIPEKLRKLLIEAFAELPYKVLWKFEDDNLPGKPKNVFIGKWIPQQDVLAHPNVKVFVTQCGLQSIEEAISRGVPMVGMPFIADQTRNIRRLSEEGAAIGLDHTTVTKEEFKNAIIEVISNPKYKENVKRLADIWVDHPLPSLNRTIWWIEYVIRHKGTKHLRSPTADVSWFEYLLVDVILVLLLAISLVIFVLYKTVKFILTRICGGAKIKQN
ncbi:unnamed protein product [Acanthoscelides obtectus]|uniref:UDP-glucuronosyltransferase n=1 Tax=Acanthoscelides obtectus TaxID=200917 RepID=A0A9P0PPC1_ACAOB|nr:unnamed protein product [Acanthoscelides obtectus]CAK1658157.1 UDP-glucuronosyltransferase 2B7 [Acanthoscelides obtectus]